VVTWYRTMFLPGTYYAI